MLVHYKHAKTEEEIVGKSEGIDENYEEDKDEEVDGNTNKNEKENVWMCEKRKKTRGGQIRGKGKWEQ